MSDSVLFALRPLEGKSETLDGAFRVHFHADDLKSLNLSVGDAIVLKNHQSGKQGIAIAWRSPSSNTRRLVKISHTLKEVFDFALSDKVSVSYHASGLPRAREVWVRPLSTLEPDGSERHHPCTEHMIWSALYNLDGIWTGGHFDVSNKYPKQTKERFVIERLEGHREPNETIASPWAFQNDAKLQMTGDVAANHSTNFVHGHTQRTPTMDFTGIGGLDHQLERLKSEIAYMQRLVEKPENFIPYLQEDHPSRILLHGASGTGKSLVLSKIENAGPFKKALRLPSLPVGTSSKVAQNISQTFSDALAHQPSAVVIDRLDKLAGKDDSSIAHLLASEIDRLGCAQVMVIAAAKNANELDPDLRPYFDCEIELPVPDMRARHDILRTLRSSDSLLSPADQDLSAEVAAMTHGFVGRDLQQLCREADRAARRRQSHGSTDPQKNGDKTVDLINSADESDRLVLSSSTILADFQAASKLIRPTAMREVFFETPQISWSDIGGSESVKRALWRVVDLPFKYPDIMARSPYVPPKGILLYGPPGCSKTLTAKAIASSSGLNFISVKGAEFTSMYVGETERALREVFRKAQTASPSVIFFDEIDAIAAARESGHGTPGLNVVTTLLTEMDGMQALRDVLVLAATNRPDVLDPALLRPGRFDTVLYVPPPPLSARKQILALNTRHDSFGQLDLDDLAVRTEGFSGAEIVEICNRAVGAWTEREVMAVLAANTASGDAAMAPVDVDSGSISMSEFDREIGQMRKVITPEMVKRYEDWAAQRGDIAQL